MLVSEMGNGPGVRGWWGFDVLAVEVYKVAWLLIAGVVRGIQFFKRCGWCGAMKVI